ncbi:Putative Glutathione peroxidase [Rhizopus microsporus]|nr:Putative Glutathione peroxidase [Rhizopus microsporus]
MTTLYDFTVKNIKGEDWNLADLKGKVVLVVNVASKCGFTKQYAGLEELYQNEVNGDNEAPLWKWMKESQPGILGLKRVKWNFEKFLIDREGKVVKRYASTTEPKSIAEEVEKHL